MKPRLRGALRQNNYQAAQNADDADDLIKVLGEKRRDILRIEHTMNDKIAEIKKKYEEKALPLKSEVTEIIAAVQAWAESNRDELTQDGKVKTIRLPSGQINWRTRPPKVSLRGKPKILNALKDLGLMRFIRTTEDINKEAMLSEKNIARQIQGVTISSAGEDFVITPCELEIEDKK